MLELKRPLAFLDLETTGVSLGRDRIVEIAVIKLMPDGSRPEKIWRINPEMPIPAESTAIHGISDADVAASPRFKEVANEIKMFLENCDLAGYNSNRFDVPMLMEEFLRAGLKDIDLSSRRMVDVQHIFYKMEPRTLVAAYKFFCDKCHDNAHTAYDDVKATIEVLEAQIGRYEGLGRSVDSILNQIGEDKVVDYARRMVFDDKGIEVFNFGKHKGRSVADVFEKERSYYDWMMQGDFPLHTKQKITEILNRKLIRK